MRPIRIINVALISIIGLLNGCIESNEPYDPYATLTKDIATIDDYLSDNSITAIKDVRGVRMVIDELGTGLPALESNKVKVAYSGRVLGSSTPFETGVVTGNILRGYILGWRIAMTTLPVGSKAEIYIPSPLAYGNQDQSKIPANSILVFDIDFQDIEESETEKQRLHNDSTAIDSYLTTKEIQNVVSVPGGLRYVVTQEGTGPQPAMYTPVKLKLTYKLLTKDTETAHTQTLEPSANYGSRVVDQINGLKLGLQLMKEGGKATFYIPSGLAYGPDVISNESNAVIFPANSNLIVEVELLDVL
jgi:FKBP-type peptidyl-prolyl cis-trans isomerase